MSLFFVFVIAVIVGYYSADGLDKLKEKWNNE